MIRAVDPARLRWFLEQRGLAIGPPQRDLRKVVVLAGANGSGKSRYLAAVAAALAAAAHPFPGDRAALRAQYVVAMEAQPKGADLSAFYQVVRAIDAREAFAWDGEPNDFPVCINLTHDEGALIRSEDHPPSAAR
jgi:hypothetical protein